MMKNLMSIDTALLETRALVYKIVSVGFLYPDDIWQKRMLGLIGEFYKISDYSKPEEIFKAVEDDIAKIEERLLRYARNDKLGVIARNEIPSLCSEQAMQSNLGELQEEHFRLFGPDPLCHLDIAHWVQGDVFMQSRRMAEMAGFYRAFGLDMNEGLRVDNLSIAFEFLSYLCIKILHAIEKGDDDKIEITEKAFNSFRDEFILPGLDGFMKSIKANSTTGFYEILGELVERGTRLIEIASLRSQ